MQNIIQKLNRNERLSEDDALELFNCKDLVLLSKLAYEKNKLINSDRVFYNINRHINPTNICVLSCKFCAFSRKPGEEGAYAYDISEMVEKAKIAVSQGATELHMVGGLHPRWSFKHYCDMISTLKKEFPETHLKAFTAVELDWFAKKERRPMLEILHDLKNSGLGSLPGGGAEIFHADIRDQICETKVSGEQWIATHRLAHSMGLRSNCTMLYGHIENYFHRVDHMRRLRELQDETEGFNVFIPLSFQPYHNDLGKTRYTMGSDDLKTLAVARLYLDNFKNIKSYWVMLGQDVAQLGLSFGANDLDGTVTEEKISRMAGGRAGMVMTRLDLEMIISKTRRNPVERDTLYKPLQEKILHGEAGPIKDLKTLNEEELISAVQNYEPHQIAEQISRKNSEVKIHQSKNVFSHKILLNGSGDKIDWNLFVKEICAIKEQNASEAQIEISENVLITPREVLNACAMARVLLPESTALGFDLGSYKALSPMVKVGAELKQHPSQKLIPVLANFGVDDLGFFQVDSFNLEELEEDLASVGKTLKKIP